MRIYGVFSFPAALGGAEAYLFRWLANNTHLLGCSVGNHPLISLEGLRFGPSSGEEEEQPRTVERKIYRGHKTRKLRELNDGGKLEMVQIKTHNSSDFSDMVLRPKHRKRSKNGGGGRVPTGGILECEGGSLVP